MWIPCLDRLRLGALALLLLLIAGGATAQERTLRLLTRPLFVPTDVVEAFTRETGIRVEVTEVEADELVERLRARPDDFDLAQPAQDRVLAAQTSHQLFRPLDMARIDSARYLPAMLAATRLNTSVGNQVYAVPHLWGTDGLVVDTRFGQSADLQQLCADPAAKVGALPTRGTLVFFALAAGLDPFAAYTDSNAYASLMEQAYRRIEACSPQLQWRRDTDQLLGGLRRREWAAALLPDGTTWRLARWLPELRYNVPATGVPGWIVGYALPARGRDDAAAYAWINHNLQPRVAGQVASGAGQFSAVRGAEQHMDPALRRQFAQSFPTEALRRIRWYPPVPADIEAIDARLVARLRAGR